MKKIIRCLPALIMLLLLCGSNALAANYKPGKVTGVKAASVGETGFTLKWKKVSKATGYYIYQVNGTSAKKIASTKSTSYKVSKLTPNKTYQYKVVAYRTVEKKTYVSDSFSGVITVTPKLKKPAKPSGFRVGVNGSKTLELTWNKATNATGYEVFSYDKSTGTYTKVKTLTGTSCQFSGLKVGEKYTYAVRSYRKVSGQFSYSGYTALVSAEPVQVSAAAASVRTFRYIRKTKKKVTVYNYDKKKNQTLAAGTKMYVSSKTTGGYLYGYLTNGQKVRIKASVLSSASGIEFNPSGDYTQAVKEEFVNTKNLSSPTKYLVWINHYKTRVNIFKGSVGKWKLVKTFKVSIGKLGSPRGLRKIYGRTRWGYENQPLVYWSPGGNSFHSMLGVSAGTATSGGCIRCYASDLFWIYNNIPDNTTVYSY